MAIIDIRAVTKKYASVTALRSVSLSISEHTVFGLLGPNGAGKTTLIRLLTNLMKPTSGEIYIEGNPVSRQTAQQVGYLAQMPTYYRWMSAYELLEFSGKLYGMSASQRKERIPQMLELCGLSAATQRKIGEFSGGMRQRLGIAQAILHEPKAVFLDEPASALDPQGRKEVLSLIDALRAHTTVLMSSHILDDVQRVCDEVAIINHGGIVLQERMDTLLETHAQSLVRCQFASEEDAIEAAQLLHRHDIGVTQEYQKLMLPAALYEEKQQEILSLIAANQWQLKGLSYQKATLEDVFLHHTQEANHV